MVGNHLLVVNGIYCIEKLYRWEYEKMLGEEHEENLGEESMEKTKEEWIENPI